MAATTHTAGAGWYSIEMVIFSRQTPAGKTVQWPAIESLPDWSHAITIQPGVAIPTAGQTDLTPDGGQQQKEKPAEIDRSAPYSLLPKSNLRLKAVAEALRRSNGRFTPLLHLAWRQPGQSKRSAKTLYLQSADTRSNAIPKLEGTVKLSVQRFLHINLDLVLQQAATKSADGGGLLPSNRQGAERRGYRFTTHRRMRSGELHYLDHSMLGAILIVSPS